MAHSKTTHAQMSDEALAKKKATLQTILAVLSGLLLVTIGYLVYRLASSDDAMRDLLPLGIVLVMIGGIAAINLAQRNQVTAEQKKRKSTTTD